MDIAVVVNVHARRGSARVADMVQDLLPRARVLASTSLDDTRDFTSALRARLPDLLVSAGGDGSAVAVLNALRGPGPLFHGASPVEPAFGLLPLGTGNAWAHASGAPTWKRALSRLGALGESLEGPPTRRFQLVEVDGVATPFAGTGWDAEVLADYHAWRSRGVLPASWRRGMPGYMGSLFLRSVPRAIFRSPPEVELVNLGSPALLVDAQGNTREVEGGGPGAVLYRGPLGVCGAGTTEMLGFGFRAFPFVDAAPNRFCFRIYAASVFEATLRLPQLWRGRSGLPHDHVWMLDRCLVRFSRPVPFEVGGDVVGERTEVEYRLSHAPVDVLDWRALSRERAAA